MRRIFTRADVAPFTGAWIEISWGTDILAGATSLPSRERGLKLRGCQLFGLPAQVAPFTGAWIEMAAYMPESWSGISRSLYGSVD